MCESNDASLINKYDLTASMERHSIAERAGERDLPSIVKRFNVRNHTHKQTNTYSHIHTQTNKHTHTYTNTYTYTHTQHPLDY